MNGYYILGMLIFFQSIGTEREPSALNGQKFSLELAA